MFGIRLRLDILLRVILLIRIVQRVRQILVRFETGKVSELNVAKP